MHMVPFSINMSNYLENDLSYCCYCMSTVLCRIFWHQECLPCIWRSDETGAIQILKSGNGYFISKKFCFIGPIFDLRSVVRKWYLSVVQQYNIIFSWNFISTLNQSYYVEFMQLNLYYLAHSYTVSSQGCVNKF